MIVVNTTFQLCPWADALYAMDKKWWDVYRTAVVAAFRGLLATVAAAVPGVEKVKLSRDLLNSGAGAVALARLWGAARIILLGFDCQRTNGQAHWHGDHPAGLGNAGSLDKWPAQFRDLARQVRDVDVVNCSRATALTCFRRAPLEAELEVTKPPLRIMGMHGMGDNLHQRAIVRELMRAHDVWLDTPWPSIYHDLVGRDLHLVSKGSRLRTQAKNARHEAALFDPEQPPAHASLLSVGYPPAMVRKHRGVLAAMSAQVGVPVGDFRLPVPADWRHGLDLPADRPVMVFRPLVERTEWTGCVNRNPDRTAYLELLASVRERFFVVSVADLEPGKEWLAQPDIGADLTLHAGELDFRALAALWRDAALVFTAPGFGVVLAQAVGTPVVAVFGGYEAGYSFAAGAAHTPTLAVEPRRPCDCFSHTHRCNKAIDLSLWLPRLADFAASSRDKREALA